MASSLCLPTASNPVPRVLLVVLIAAVVGTACNSQVAPQVDQQPADASPAAFFTKKVLPPVIVGDPPVPLDCVFPIENRSEEPLTFKALRPSCGCAEASLDAWTLAPGETTYLRLSMNLRGRSGPQRLTCTLEDEQTRPWRYELETVAYQRAQFLGELVVHFGMVDPSSVLERTIEFCCYAETEAALPTDPSFTLDSPYVTLSAQSGRTEKTNDGLFVSKVPLHLRLKAPAEAVTGQAHLTAKYRCGEKSGSIAIGADWCVRAFLTAQPGQVYFDLKARTAETPVERRIMLKRTDGQVLVIHEVSSPHPAVTCTVQNLTKATALVIFTCDVKKTEDFLTGEAIVQTNHPVQQAVRLPVAVAPR